MSGQNIEQPKKKTNVVIWVALGFILLFIIIVVVGVIGGEKGEGGPAQVSQSTEEKIQAPQQTPKKANTIYSADQEVQVGKSIWVLRGIIDKGWVLKGGSRIGQVYEVNHSENFKLVGVILEFVNMAEISDEISKEFLSGVANRLRFKGSVSATLIDDNNKRFKNLSSDEAYYILPQNVDSRLDDIYTKYIKDPDLYPIFTLFFSVPIDAEGFKVEVRDETTYSDEKILINLGL